MSCRIAIAPAILWATVAAVHERVRLVGLQPDALAQHVGSAGDCCHADQCDKIERLAAVKLGDADDAMCRRPLDLVPGVIDQVAGAGSAGPTAYRISDESRHRIGHRCARLQSVECQNELLLDWARGRGRVSSTEAADLIDVSIVTAGRRLAALAADGLLTPSRPNGTGRGFHYLPEPT